MRYNDVTFRRGVVEGGEGIGCCVLLKIGMAELRSRHRFTAVLFRW